MSTRLPTFALALSLSLAAMSLRQAQAATPPGGTPQNEQEGIRHYQEGRQLLSRHKVEEALRELRASYELLPSPNTELLIAHALREMGHKAEAMTHYEHVLADATARVRQGEKRFEATLEESGRWSAVLRPGLGQLEIVVKGVSPDVKLVVDGEATTTELDATSGGRRAKPWHEPGRAVVTARVGDGPEQSKTVEVSVGQVASVELDLTTAAAAATPATAATEAPTEPAEPSGGGAVPAPPWPSYVAAGVGVVGFAFFAGFGAASASVAGDLDECAPRCPLDMQERADAGKRNQTIANVSVIVGAVGLAAAGTIWLVDALTGGDSEPSPASSESPAAAVSIGPGSAVVVGRF